MANYCCDYKILAAGNTLAPSNVFTTGYTNLTWGYNQDMAKTSGLGFQPSSSEIVQAPTFQSLTPDQEKAFLSEVASFDFLYGNDFDLWGEDEATKTNPL